MEGDGGWWMVDGGWWNVDVVDKKLRHVQLKQYMVVTGRMIRLIFDVSSMIISDSLVCWLWVIRTTRKPPGL